MPWSHSPTPPSKKELLAFLRSHPGAGKRDIARAFGLSGADRGDLRALLRELAEDGAIERRRRRLHVPGALPAVVLAA